jgi:hypothetical protein
MPNQAARHQLITMETWAASMRLMLGEMAVEQVFLRVLQFPLLIITTTLLHPCENSGENSQIF